MIPCKEIKCLKYPICKTARIIVCSILKKYYEKVSVELQYESKTMWNQIEEDFSELESLSYEEIEETNLRIYNDPMY